MIALKYDKKVVFDAGSIIYLSHNEELLNNKKCSAVLTPHPGEFSKLINLDMNEIKTNGIMLKFPKRLVVYYILMFAVPIIASWYLLTVFRVFDFSDALKAFMTPVAFISVAAIVLYLVFLFVSRSCVVTLAKLHFDCKPN